MGGESPDRVFDSSQLTWPSSYVIDWYKTRRTVYKIWYQQVFISIFGYYLLTTICSTTGNDVFLIQKKN